MEKQTKTIKPDFESAIVLSTFIEMDLPDALHKLANYLDVNKLAQDYDSDMRINACYNSTMDAWHVSLMTHYSIDKKIVKLIKK